MVSKFDVRLLLIVQLDHGFAGESLKHWFLLNDHLDLNIGHPLYIFDIGRGFLVEKIVRQL